MVQQQAVAASEIAPPPLTAAVLVIGNEVLSGRVRDANIGWLADTLKGLGIKLAEARVIADIEAEIIDAVNALRARYTYVFTTGGIGPTHDDITAACVAKAFGVGISRRADAVAVLTEYYGDQVNEQRLKMAEIPDGADLLDNPVSRAPGFRLGNVHVLPGIPRIMQGIVDGFKDTLIGGEPLQAMQVIAYIPESKIAPGLEAVQNQFPAVEIGCYPWVRQQRFGSSLVFRGRDRALIHAAAKALYQIAEELGVEAHLLDGEEVDPFGDMGLPQ